MKNGKWETIEYTKTNGESPVRNYLDSLYPKDRAKVLRTIGLLENFGMGLPGPHKDYLEDGIYELRTKLSSNIYRVTFFHYQARELVLLHGFTKKTQKTPKREIEKAKIYRDDYLDQKRRKKS